MLIECLSFTVLIKWKYKSSSLLAGIFVLSHHHSGYLQNQAAVRTQQAIQVITNRDKAAGLPNT